MYDFLDRVNEVRNGMSISAFARVLGMGQKTVDFYMRGERKPSVEFVVNICSKFGKDANWLLGLPARGGDGSAHVTAGAGAAVSLGSGNATAKTGGDCSKCKLMQAHLREITGRG